MGATAAAPEVDERTFSVSYRLTAADARSIVWIVVREGLPMLVGLALLVLVAGASVFGVGGHAAQLGVPWLVGLWLLWSYRRALRSIAANRTSEITTAFRRSGVGHVTATIKTEIAWSALRRIRRYRSGWVFATRTGGRFFVPARAIPDEARAPIARWAAAGQVRLD